MFEPHVGISAGCVIVFGQSNVPELEKPEGIAIVNVTVLAVSVVTVSNPIGEKDCIVPLFVVPFEIEPFDAICWPLNPAMSHVNSGSPAGCVKVAEHSTVAAAFE